MPVSKATAAKDNGGALGWGYQEVNFLFVWVK